MKNTHPQIGMTMIELLVVIAIAAILVMIAVPSMRESQRISETKGLLRDIHSAMVFARSEALTKGQPVSICPSITLKTCATSSDWGSGWIVFVDNGDGKRAANGIYNKAAGEQLLRAYGYAGSGIISVRDPDDNNNTSLSSITLNHRGYPSKEKRALVVVCDADRTLRHARGLTMELSGRISKTRDNDGNGVHEITLMDFSHNGQGVISSSMECPK